MILRSPYFVRNKKKDPVLCRTDILLPGKCHLLELARQGRTRTANKPRSNAGKITFPPLLKNPNRYKTPCLQCSQQQPPLITALHDSIPREGPGLGGGGICGFRVQKERLTDAEQHLVSPVVPLAPLAPVPDSRALLAQSCCHSPAAQLLCFTGAPGMEERDHLEPRPGVPLLPPPRCPFVPVPLAPVVCEQVTEVSWQKREEGRDVEAARGGAGTRSNRLLNN